MAGCNSRQAINQRDDAFEDFIPLASKGAKDPNVIFKTYTNGIQSNRDPWVQNYSREQLKNNVRQFASYYNDAVGSSGSQSFEDWVDSSRISWTRNLKKRFSKGEPLDEKFEATLVDYRPFTKQWAAVSRQIVEYVNQTPAWFSDANSGNRILVVSGVGSQRGYSAFVASNVADVQLIQNGQCYPLQTSSDVEGELFSSSGSPHSSGITPYAFKRFTAAYPAETITAEDIFYYVYGILMSEDFRNRFSQNLLKETPRIPVVVKATDFWLFSKAGRTLSDLHVNYEEAEPYPVNFAGGSLLMDSYTDTDFRVEKMRFGGKGKVKDKSTVIYNGKFTMTDIPLEAYDYVVNGKPALEWVMERQVVKTDKDSGIVNDANRYAIETVGDAAYPLKLFQRIITVSLETMKIVRSLPKLDI
ncbi:type ISP restriction/modification enzyme [Qipengyuania vulgaris]|uniref:type ISP restriction/modification enzyme n=1 Tax=Qipengyuania vulgaris TaxID=291985 RepID=UPI0019261572|nr:type ISP restriction/modification enzyme [Qipengyuania vulgaris]